MRRASAVLLAALSLGSAGCRRGNASSGDPYADAVQRAIPIVEKGVGLRFKSPPQYASRTREQIHAFVVAQFEKGDELQKLAGRTTAYKRLGMLPDSLDARKLFESLLSEQIAGFYDPKTKTFYFVADGEPAAVGLVASHELVHALQDQYLNIDSIDASGADDDRLAAAHALLEGQATLNMVGGQGFAAMVGSGWERVRDAIREQRAAAPVFSAAPRVIQEELLFPYLNGADFMRRAREHDPARDLLHDLPTSTEQVIHDAAYFGTRDAPTTVVLPALAAAPGDFQNTLGEFSTRLFLFQQSNDAAAAARAAAGWDGDRYVVVRGAAGETLTWASVWDSAIDAAEFVSAATEAAARRYGASVPQPAAGQPHLVRARGRLVTITSGEVGGRPVVVYTDEPEGAQAAIAPSTIVLRPAPAR